MLNLADLAKMAGQNQDYVDWLGKAIKAKPEILQPYRTLVTYYLNNKNTKNALSTALLAQTNNPGNPDVLDLLGATQIAVGKKTEALTTYNHLVNLAPKSLLAFMRLGSLQVLMQDSTNARLSFKQALDLRPDSPEAQTALLKLDVQAGDYSAALARAQQMQRAQAGNGLGYNLEGDVLMVQKQYSQAAKAYAKALEVSKNGLFAIKQQQALSIAGLKTEAEATLLTWLKKTPGDLQTRLYLGDLYGQSGRYSEAIEQYQYILGKGGSSVPLLNNLAWSYARLKDPRALPTAEKAYQSAPTNAVILDTYGWILLEQGNAARAVQLLKNAADKSTSPAIHYHLAAALVKSGNTAQARMELEQLLRNSANFPDKVAAQTLLNTLRH
jgi:putative PEP-CTERM system TPR-repeat lipoprotein